MSRPVCPCGPDRVPPVPRLGLRRWIAAVLLGGVDLPPREIRFGCRVCETAVGATRDAEVLRAYAHGPLFGRDALCS